MRHYHAIVKKCSFFRKALECSALVLTGISAVVLSSPDITWQRITFLGLGVIAPLINLILVEEKKDHLKQVQRHLLEVEEISLNTKQEIWYWGSFSCSILIEIVFLIGAVIHGSYDKVAASLLAIIIIGGTVSQWQFNTNVEITVKDLCKRMIDTFDELTTQTEIKDNLKNVKIFFSANWEISTPRY
jgi:hypothetical protein